MKPVSGASTDGDDSSSSRNRYALFAALAVAIFFVVSLGGSSDAAKESHNVRSGQVTQRTSPVEVEVRPSAKKSGEDDDDGKDVASVPDVMTADEEEEIVEDAKKEFTNIEQEELEAEAKSLEKRLESYYNWMKVQIAELLEDFEDFDQDDIERLANKCQDKLDTQVHDEVKDQADELKKELTEELEADLDADTEGIESGVEEAVPIDIEEDKAIMEEELRDGIDEVVLEEEDNMKLIAANVVKGVLEKELKKVTGHSYTIKVSSSGKLSKPKRKSSHKTTTAAVAEETSPTSTHTTKHHSTGTKKHSSTVTAGTKDADGDDGAATTKTKKKKTPKAPKAPKAD